MARQVVLEKLESLRRCVARIEARRPPSVAALGADLDAQDILSVNLTRAVQLAVDLATHLLAGREVMPPPTMGESFLALAEAGVIPLDLAHRLKAAVGFRNVAVHSYRSLDWAVVFRLVSEHLLDFEDLARAVLAHLDAPER